MADYAAAVVNEIKQICDVENVDHPTLVSESGRAITAHHSCVVMQVMGEISNNANPVATDPVSDEDILVTNMHDLLVNLDDTKNYQDVYNEATWLFDDILHAFKLGVLRLEELARSETLYWQLLSAISRGLDDTDFVSEDLRNMQTSLKSQYLCNFSLFQSAADIWAIEQVLPVVPLTRLNEEPTRNVTLADITCDSDGRINQFVGPYGTCATLPLHTLAAGQNYYIGLFLTGAYQDVMGDTHNLFGRLNEVHVFCDTKDPTGFFIEEFVPGSSAGQVLQVMQYNQPAMAQQVKAMIDRAVASEKLNSREGVKLVDFYEACLASYTYLRHP
jgi:arginine decarboxylase